ncbi:hypothetical protein K491DRAFT_589345 [Lophiostoma macrostomum CBS 122681]|uniref:Uncharacterized protein n=1 Tax=Lophiostoma macrostomum CBS 122681 TaxID=1314788 RepID=A0A6A6TLI1_9PLEO|nr:hypothetical protein K491DRAFT_589345 [Lophiostoma macrostomum CBS 122681]
MPRVKSFTPEWLMRPNPGHEMFTPKTAPPNQPAALGDMGKRKTIATRDTEIFVAAGTEIRWADLVALKEGIDSTETPGSYRTLKVAVPLPITQLVVSPGGDLMAVSTSHTVHVVVLPDSSLLDAEDTGPIKVRTFQIGPVAHVREESSVASVLWHPLGYHGHCLITITREGVVRLWETNRADRKSFMDPSLSIDLKKLANAESDQADLSASKYGAPKGFSPDAFELEVASACFGDFPDQEGVHGWAPMTLWIAMVEGDVYALCPLLPSKWQLQESAGVSTVLQTLATSINADFVDVQENTDATPEEVETAQRQLQWLFDLVYKEAFQEQLPSGESLQVFARPDSVPACPLLQGPFQINQSEDEYFELSDIIVFSLKTFSESDEEELVEGLPAAVICLLTDSSKIHICLDLLGVVGRWLPSENRTAFDTSAHELNLVETVVLSNEQKSSFNQSITPDVHTDFSFFVSSTGGTYYISLESWIRKLEEELADPQSERIDFRLSRLLDSAATQVDACIQRSPKSGVAEDGTVEQVTSCVVVEDGNVGYLVLTVQGNEPQAVILDAPEDVIQTPEGLAESMDAAGIPIQTRELFAPSKDLWSPLHFLQIKDHLIPARHSAPSKEEIRLSPANLDILMNAHKALSQDTHRLQTAVADLFVRCQRLRDEFHDQVVRTAKLADKIDESTGGDGAGSGGDSYSSAKIEDRLERVKAKQDALNARYDTIRRKMAHVGGAELSEKEAKLVETLQVMERSLDPRARTLTDDARADAGSDVDAELDESEQPAWQRLDKVRRLKEDLGRQVQRVEQEGAEYEEREREREREMARAVRVPTQSRRAENEQVELLLQRETALVESAMGRLRNLGIRIQGGA